MPEEHISKDLHNLRVNTVTLDCELAKHSFEYLNRVLNLLKREYGENLEDVVFQLGNEPFYRFGELGMVMSDKYVLEIVRVLKEYFPKDYRYKLIRLWGVK